MNVGELIEKLKQFNKDNEIRVHVEVSPDPIGIHANVYNSEILGIGSEAGTNIVDIDCDSHEIDLSTGEKTRGIYPNVAVSVKLLKKPKGFCKDVLTVEQIKNLLTSIDTSTLRGKRDYALINLLVRTGLRTIEAVRADVVDLEQSGFEATLRVWGKGRESKDEKAILTYEVLRPIQDYLYARQSKNDDEPLFVSTIFDFGKKIFNKKTEQVLKDIKARKNMKKFTNSKDLFRDLGME